MNVLCKPISTYSSLQPVRTSEFPLHTHTAQRNNTGHTEQVRRTWAKLRIDLQITLTRAMSLERLPNFCLSFFVCKMGIRLAFLSIAVNSEGETPHKEL
jgi:hypothetical protein